MVIGAEFDTVAVNVHVLHGCASNWAGDQQNFRNFVSEGALRTFLEGVTRPYRNSLSPDDCRVLTIDDSTQGAVRAAKLARACGHEVILFVNPHQIVTGQPYFFSVLNACLDSRTVSRVSFQGTTYDLDADVVPFRSVLKRLFALLDPAIALHYTGEIGDLLQSTSRDVPAHARPATLTDLEDLHEMGVKIENHGWSHQHIDALGPERLKADVRATAEWLAATLDIHSRYYAVPFGETVLDIAQLEEAADTVFLSDSQHQQGRLGSRTWNRLEITRTVNTCS